MTVHIVNKINDAFSYLLKIKHLSKCYSWTSPMLLEFVRKQYQMLICSGNLMSSIMIRQNIVMCKLLIVLINLDPP